MAPLTVYTLGTFTFGGTLLFETPTERCILMLTGMTVRLPKPPTP